MNEDLRKKNIYASLPFGIIEVVDDPEEKLEMFTNLITECIERHAPLKRTKITRPPAPVAARRRN